MKFSKRTFFLGEEPVSVDNLSTYLRGEKPETGNATAAWSSHTGKGLLFFVKHAEEKKQPQGVLNLAEASDIEKASQHEFTFKIHGHKHTFKAANDAERDAWVVSIEKAMAEAKANKDAVTSSEIYKETLASLAKAHPVHAGAAGRKSVDAPRPRAGSSSSSSSSDAEAAAKKAKKSRSASRSGKRHSLFGNFMNKKDEHDAKKEEKKEDKAVEADKPATEAVEEPVAAEAAPLEAEAIGMWTITCLNQHDTDSVVAARVIDAPVEEAKVAEEKPVESAVDAPVTEVPANVEEVPAAESAPAVEAAAVAAEEKPVEEKPVEKAVNSVKSEEKKKSEERPKTNKRSSIFGAFFDKVRSPTSEKKESEVAPVVPPKETVVSAEPPVLPEPTTENTALDPSASENAAAPAVAEPVAEASKEAELEPKAETPMVVTPNGTERKKSFFDSLVNKARSKSPAPAASTEAPAVPPKDDEVVAAPEAEVPAATTEPAAETPVAPTAETKVETPKVATPKDGRRKSYFGAFGGAKKDKTDVETPQEDKSVLGKVTGLFRTKSQAARPAKKENVPTEAVPAVPATETAAEPTVESKVDETPAVVEPKAEEPAIETAAPAVESQQTPANPTVSAAA